MESFNQNKKIIDKMKYMCIRETRIYGLLAAGILLFLIILPGCDDIFEKDLTKQKVKLLAPGNGLVTDYSTQTFYWEEIKGATSYNLTIVTKSFDHIEQIVADTNVVGHKFTIHLNPGNDYEWRVLGKNGSSKTDSFSIWHLRIDTTSDLNKQQVDLLSPGNSAITNKAKNISFEWNKIPKATGYEFKILKSNFDSVLTSSSIVYNDSLADGNYTWEVKAINSNNNTSTLFSMRTILIDATKPATPSLTEPIKGTTSNTRKVKMVWNRQKTDGGSALSDDIYISTDSSALATYSSSVNKFTVDTIGFYYTFSADNSYYWRVVTFDQAGNRSDPSAIEKFKIKVPN